MEQINVRPLVRADLPEAHRIVRLAFETFLGFPESPRFTGDAAYVWSRWGASPDSAFAAEVDGVLAGSNFATRWGSFGFFGPLSLDPRFWNRGLASVLIEPVMEAFDAWGVTHTGLFTFAESPKHIGLYQKFGFRPRALTLILGRNVDPSDRSSVTWTRYSELDPHERSLALRMSRELTDGIYPGLDVTPEILSIEAQSLGNTILVTESDLEAFAACHAGAGSEAGTGVCYVKFGAAAAGGESARLFRRLLEAIADFAARAGLARIEAGVSAARGQAYEEMLRAGYRVERTGVAMHRPNEPGFSRPDAFVIDDWR
jgi:GNAT superfamily N-acetyltransferase